MTNNLYDALEYCLQAMEEGASLESQLARFPELESELRPILEASQRAREMPVPMPSAEKMRIGRAQLLQRAAEMREAKRPAKRRSVIPFFQRMAIALTLATTFLLSGTGLVQASSTALPGENLYPVKRTWEDMRLLFVFTPEVRDAMEGQYEQERLDEVSELLRKGRVVSITFTGLVTADANGNMLVSGVPVIVSPNTRFTGDPLVVGVAVVVTGQTDDKGQVTALTIQVLKPGAVVPTGESSDEDDSSSSGGSSSNGNNSSSGGSDSSQNNNNDPINGTFHIEGTVQSINGNVWVIDGRTVYVENPALLGLVRVGMQVEVKGYFAADGRFVVTRVEIKNSGSNNQGGDVNSNAGNGGGSDTNSNSNENGNDNGNVNDNNNENGNDNLNSNENTNSNETENHNGNENSNTNSNSNENSNDSGSGNGNTNDNGNGNSNDNKNDNGGSHLTLEQASRLLFFIKGWALLQEAVK